MTLSAVQLEQRKHGIGSSDIAAVLGLNPMSSPIKVWCVKTGRDTDEAGEQADLGNDIEELIARRAIRQLGVKDAFKEATHVHPAEVWALATPDFRLGPGWFLEVKNVGHRMLHHWGDSDKHVPEYVQLQCQWQMGVCDATRVTVAALLGGRPPLRIVDIAFDAELFAYMLQAGRRFWHEWVLADVQPPVDGSAYVDRWLAKRFPAAGGASMKADAEARAAVAELHQLRALRAVAEVDEKKAVQRLKELMGSSTALDADEWGVISWREARGKVAWQKVAEELGATPALAEKHRSAPQRRFTVPRWWGLDDEESGSSA